MKRYRKPHVARVDSKEAQLLQYSLLTCTYCGVCTRRRALAC
jgi:heterodisulfide reductase subunit C